MFIKKSTLNRLLKEERRISLSLGFDTGYNTCLAEHGGKGFITGRQKKAIEAIADMVDQVEAILKEKGV